MDELGLTAIWDMIDYTYWGRDRILDAASDLTQGQLRAQTWLDHGSIYGTLLHQFSAEVLWRERWEGRKPSRALKESDVLTIYALPRLWVEHEARVRVFLAGLSDSDLLRPVQYRSQAGVKYSDPLWQVLLQFVNHGTQHRSEVALALTQLGHSPGFLDYMAYVRERNAG